MFFMSSCPLLFLTTSHFTVASSLLLFPRFMPSPRVMFVASITTSRNVYQFARQSEFCLVNCVKRQVWSEVSFAAAVSLGLKSKRRAKKRHEDFCTRLTTRKVKWSASRHTQMCRLLCTKMPPKKYASCITYTYSPLTWGWFLFFSLLAFYSPCTGG